MGLGSLNEVSLKEARERVIEARKLINIGQDPITARTVARAAPAIHDISFGDYAKKVLPTITHGFKNRKAAAQWNSTLTQYAKPIWRVPIRLVTNHDVKSCIEPI